MWDKKIIEKMDSILQIKKYISTSHKRDSIQWIWMGIVILFTSQDIMTNSEARLEKNKWKWNFVLVHQCRKRRPRPSGATFHNGLILVLGSPSQAYVKQKRPTRYSFKWLGKWVSPAWSKTSTASHDPTRMGKTTHDSFCMLQQT